MKVFILVTVRKPELLPFSLLVFKTLRVGFPTAEIFITGNALPAGVAEEIEKLVGVTGFCDMGPTVHHSWVENLVNQENKPFVILDTDLILFEKVEGWKFDTALAGYRIPEFVDEFTCAVTKPRLHTSLLFVDPVKVREAIAKYEAQFPDTIFNPKVNLFHPLCIPNEGDGIFYDTAALLYQAIGGTAFTDEQKDKYFHFHFGCIPDLVLPRLTNGDQIEVVRKMILDKPEYGRGMWRAQDNYYEERQFVRDGTSVVAPVSEEDAKEAHRWCVELCKGNQAAMHFCDLWYSYVHLIDDIVDLMIDGKPTLTKSQIISTFFNAALLYNCQFYLANQNLLFPIILDVTNAYQMSVAWERSPRQDLRTIADVTRTCGNRIYSIVALICGGESHMVHMTQRICERDYVLQHDADGRPI